MNKKSDGVNAVARAAEVGQSGNRPLATCIAALLSIVLGTSVGLMVPMGSPYASSAAITVPVTHHAVDFVTPASI